jgi:transcription termination/antitermination protein NusG
MLKQQAHTDRKWYAIHTYSGYENAVVRNLKQRIQSTDGMSDLIFDVVVPMEKKVKIKGNKKVEVEETIYPGYVLVDMIVTDESWYIIRNTPRVTGFVGAGTTPVPLTPDEITFLFDKMKNTSVEHELSIKQGDQVTVNDGPFKGFEGKVESIDTTRGKLKVMVNMFGRETPVELDFLQVKSL